MLPPLAATSPAATSRHNTMRGSVESTTSSLGGLLSPQSRYRERVRGPEAEPDDMASWVLPRVRDPPLHPARRVRPRGVEPADPARRGHSPRNARLLGSVPRRTGTRAHAATAASQQSSHHVSHRVVACHPSRQIATLPRQTESPDPGSRPRPPAGNDQNFRCGFARCTAPTTPNVPHADRRTA